MTPKPKLKQNEIKDETIPNVQYMKQTLEKSIHMEKNGNNYT